MKRLLILLLFALLLIPAVPAGAVPTDDLIHLGNYFPPSTQFYFSIRIDDEYLQETDDLLTDLDEKLDGELLYGTSLLEGLDEFAQEITGDDEADFETAVRPWLGDTLAVVVVDVADAIHDDRDPDVVIATEISDREVVEELLDTLVQSGAYDKTRNLRYALYLPKSESDQVYLLLDDALLTMRAGNDPERIRLEFDNSLADEDDLLETVERLPAESYNALLYVDAAPIAAAVMESNMPRGAGAMMGDFDMESILSLLGPQVVGFTILDDDTLVMDYAHSIPDADFSEDAITVDPINPDFAQYIPEDAFLAVHDTNLGPTLLYLLQGIESLGDFADAALPEWNPDDPQDEDALRVIDDTVTFLRLSYRGLTGVPLEDTLGWMTGDFVSYVQLEETNEGILFNVGVVVENTDPEGVEGYFDATITLVESLELDYTMEDGVITLPFLRTLLDFGDITTSDNQDILVGANDDVLAVGNRAGVESALAGEAGVTESDVYLAASEYFLPDTQTLWYLNVEAARPALSQLEGIDRDLDHCLTMLSLFESGSITATYTEEGEGLVRFVLTLAE